jgi:hypothetical protein
VANDKPTERMVLTDVMKPMADALDGWALAREKKSTEIDSQAAGLARALSKEIRDCLERLAAAETEEDTKSLQQLRSDALELLARYK